MIPRLNCFSVSGISKEDIQENCVGAFLRRKNTISESCSSNVTSLVIVSR